MFSGLKYHSHSVKQHQVQLIRVILQSASGADTPALVGEHTILVLVHSLGNGTKKIHNSVVTNLCQIPDRNLKCAQVVT